MIRNCVFKGNNALCIGSEMSGGVRSVYAISNSAPQNVEMGLFIKGSRKRGGTVENIFIKDFTFNQVNTVIAINPNYDGDTVSTYIPAFQNVFIEDITASNARDGIMIYGWKSMPTKNVTLKNVAIQLSSRKKEKSFVLGNVRDVNLSNVIIDGKKLDGTFNDDSPNSTILQIR